MNKISMDRKYRTRSGLHVRVLCIDAEDKRFPVIALVGSTPYAFTSEGIFSDRQGYDDLDLIEVSPYEDFKKNDKVIASHDGDMWFRRYFSHEFAGKAYCYADGADSWSAGGQTAPWEYCRKPTQEELKN